MSKNKVTNERMEYLDLLSRQFPTIQEVSREIINLEAIINLPKGTEHFLSDVHGEHEAFVHILKNGSGVVRRKIEEIFGNTLTEDDKSQLASLIYYPKETLYQHHYENKIPSEWYHRTLKQLVSVCREASSKYTRSKVRKALPKGFEYILEELLHEQEYVENKQAYYDQILSTILEIGQVEPFIIAISELIQRFAIDHLHIIGDIYDRGPGAHIILDTLMKYHSVDMQWGNHDIVWMGAYAGSLPCIANVVRISMRYGNHELLEEDYGINLLPLAKFAMETYKEVEPSFMPKIISELDKNDAYMIGQMHKAIAIIMFKLEGQFIKRHPEFHMENRLLLNEIDYKNNTITLENNTYELNWYDVPTIDHLNPYELSAEEMEIVLKLKASFMTNDKLKSHVDFMMAKGSIYLKYNNHILYHGCVPTEKDGSFSKVDLGGVSYSGKALLDAYERMVRKGYANRFQRVDEKDVDIFYYLWTGRYSSLFGKDVMKTFERYFIKDKSTHKELKNPYYDHYFDASYCDKIFKEFDMDPSISRIINGHVPVKVGKGEDPVKADGKLIVIDGGLSKAYQPVTDIAGYTLIYNSHGLLLATHEPFDSAKKAIEHYVDLISEISIVHKAPHRVLVAETDIGKKLKKDVDNLKELLLLFQEGLL
jgi:fructose-1,6-bisphosphatase-3